MFSMLAYIGYLFSIDLQVYYINLLKKHQHWFPTNHINFISTLLHRILKSPDQLSVQLNLLDKNIKICVWLINNINADQHVPIFGHLCVPQ